MQRTELSDRERRRRSRLAQIVHAARFLRGTLSVRSVRCGKPDCRCAHGEPMLVCTWFAAKAENCTSSLCPGSGKDVSGKRFATSKRWSD